MIATLRVGDRYGEGNGLAVCCDPDGENIAAKGTADIRLGRERAEFVTVEEIDDFLATAKPVGRGPNLSAVNEGERVVESSDIDGGDVVRCATALAQHWQGQEERGKQAFDETHATAGWWSAEL